MENEKHHIVPYMTHIMVLLGLILLTVITVLITSVELGAYNTAAAMLIASLKGAVVLLYFMHLKFDHKIYWIMVSLVIAIFTAVIVVTFFDYLYR
ncbi:MAG TPA: cytochrome C oxidase subunit IV family protein [Lentimicrobium sp.]|jgi:cytochrome c oxidase subunit 4|nr:cytochrome C oxidase subunit IV family protein [Lentimicrobium sp.]